MKGLIVRIDDRLVHGQVSAGWVEPLGIRLVVIASDAVAADDLERELYRAAVPEGVEFVCLPVREAAQALGQPDGPRAMALVGSIADARRLVEAGLNVPRLNVGGVHRGPGRVEVLPFVWLTEDERADCRSIAERGVKLEAQMLPDSQAWDLAALLEAK
ncbi:MAG: PTS sugar transporter subunit IIB [bacterium]